MLEKCNEVMHLKLMEALAHVKPLLIKRGNLMLFIVVVVVNLSYITQTEQLIGVCELSL